MIMRRLVTAVLVAMLAAPALASAQANGDIWRTFAQKLEAGSSVVVRLHNGQRFKATLIDARADAVLLQPRTRRPVPVQPVSYDAIQLLERESKNGMGAAKAAAIGVATGAGAFLAILAIFAATLD
jgi:hypothetical protein